MAVNEKRLNITEFDFDDVKDNLKVFLKNQTEFKDYDFEGSGMSILLDVLAYNTHYLGFNANMLANEMFLDSASLRSSVVSHAKTLGYEVQSARSPIATVNVALSTTVHQRQCCWNCVLHHSGRCKLSVCNYCRHHCIWCWWCGDI